MDLFKQITEMTLIFFNPTRYLIFIECLVGLRLGAQTACQPLGCSSLALSFQTT